MRPRMPRGQAELRQQIGRPAAADGIVELAGAGVAHLVALHAGQEPMEQVGHHQEGLGDAQQRRAGQLHGQQLVERVELHELQAGVAENLFAADQGERLFHHAVGAAVAIVIGVAQQFIAGGQQTEIDAPGVDAHAGYGRRPSRGGRRPQALADVGPQSQQVPVQMSGRLDGAVLEAVDFLQPQLPAVEPSQDVTAAGCPHVNRQICPLGHRLPCLSLNRFDVETWLSASQTYPPYRDWWPLWGQVPVGRRGR